MERKFNKLASFTINLPRGILALYKELPINFDWKAEL